MEEPNKVMTIRAPESLKKAFEDECKSKDITPSQIIRQFMRDFVNQSRQKQLPLKGKK